MTAIKWKSGHGGNWGRASNWSSDSIPGAADDVSIAGAISGTIDLTRPEAASSLLLSASSAFLLIDASLRVGTTFTIQAGHVLLDSGGIIQGGVIADNASGLRGLGGTLSAVTYEGTLAPPLSLTIEHGITLAGKGGAGTATLDLNGPNCAITYLGSGALDNATLLIGENSAANIPYLIAEDPANHGATLIFGPHFTIRQTGLYGQIIGATNETFVNEGLIAAASGGGTLDLQGANFVNTGQINVANGDTLLTSFMNFHSSGKIEVGSGGTLVLDSYKSSSTIALKPGSVLLAGGAMLDLNYATTTATLDAISSASGTINVQNTIRNTGTIANRSAGGVLQLDGGTISGGTLIDTGPSITLTGGLLSDVAIHGTLDVTGTSLALQGGVTFAGLDGSGAGTIDLASPNVSCLFLYGGTLNNVVMTLGSQTGSYFRQFDPNGTSSTLTFGPASQIIQSGRFANLFGGSNANDSIRDEGTITALTASGTFLIGGDNFSSAGQLAIGNADTLDIRTATFTDTGHVTNAGGTIVLETTLNNASLAPLIAAGGDIILAGTLVNAGSITLGGLHGTLTAQAATITGGTLAVTGGGLVNGGETLDNVACQGTLDLGRPGAAVNLQDNTTLSGSGGLGSATILIGDGSTLAYTGTGTLDNATAYIDDGYNGQYFDGITVINSFPDGSILTLGSHFHVVQTGTFAGLHADGFSGDGIVNNGEITAAQSGGTFFIDGSAFTNAGTIAASNGDTLAVSSTIFINTGHLSANPGGLGQASTQILFQGAITNTGTILAAAGTISVSQDVAGAGQLQIGAAGALALLAGDAAAQTVDFLAGTGLLTIENPSVLAGSIANFTASDHIDLAFTVADGFTYANHTLTITESGQTVAALHVVGTYTQADFAIGTDDVGGTLIKFV